MLIEPGTKSMREKLIHAEARYGNPEKARDLIEKKDFEAAVKRITNGRGVDVVLDATGNFRKSYRCLAPLGRLNFFGGLPKDNPMTTIDANLVHYNYLKIVGTSRQSIRQYIKTLHLIEKQKIDLKPLITETFALDEADSAFQKSGSGDGLKNLFIL